MKSVPAIAALVCSGISLSAQSVQEARTLFHQAYASKEAASSFRQLMHMAPDVPLLQGYKGLSEIMICPYLLNPFSKLSGFNKGRHILEQAIMREPANIELHFLRFAVQTNAPAILGYNTNIAQDKSLLNNYLQYNAGNNPELYSMIVHYLLRSGFCTANEKLRIKQYTQTP